MAVVAPRLVRRAAPARLADAEPRGDGGELGVRRGRLGQLREHELDHVGGDPPRPRVVGRDPHARRGTASCRRRPVRPAVDPRPGRRGRRRTARAGRRSRASGTPAPGERATASSTVAPGSTSTATPSTVDVHAPELLREVREQAADRRGHAARRARTGSRPRASRAAPRAARGRRAPSASTSSSPRCRPTRHGKHLPQLSCAPKREQVPGERAHVGAVVEGDDRCRGRACSRRRRAARSRTACRAATPGRIPPSGPPIWSAFSVAPVAHPAAEPLADLPQRRPEPHLVGAGPREALVQADELRARRRARAERRVTPRPVQRDERRGAERLDVVDDRRQAAPAALGRERRARRDGCRAGPRARRAARSPRRRRSEPAPSATETWNEKPLPWMSSPRSPAATAAAIAASSARFARGYSERT